MVKEAKALLWEDTQVHCGLWLVVTEYMSIFHEQQINRTEMENLLKTHASRLGSLGREVHTTCNTDDAAISSAYSGYRDKCSADR
jgi:hypothetical protein